MDRLLYPFRIHSISPREPAPLKVMPRLTTPIGTPCQIYNDNGQNERNVNAKSFSNHSSSSVLLVAFTQIFLRDHIRRIFEAEKQCAPPTRARFQQTRYV